MRTPASSPAPTPDAHPSAPLRSSASPREPGGPRVSTARALLEDGSLALEADGDVLPVVATWLPRVPEQPGDGAAARIHVRFGECADRPPSTRPEMELRTVGGWVLPGERVVLHEPGARIGGEVDLAARRADVWVRPGETAESIELEVAATLTIASALLLTRLGRALVHAAAVVPPGGGGTRLLAGGTFSGKTTTCLTLVRAGWAWLADDAVILHPGEDGAIHVEGWPRRFNLDHGYAHGQSAGVRSRVEPEAAIAERWRRSAPLAGLLFPRVEAERTTALEPLHPAGALSLLLRHSPWILADAAGAPPVLALLQRAAQHPAHGLRLGRDSYCDASTLQFSVNAAK